eukprot:GHVN01024524.1.p2 GENE.GHVN01024524.1~~GHVN01024524.1.p2  ORF type:complete len:129 (-),score=16.37 GHVN01024524.1:527-913(-)
MACGTPRQSKRMIETSCFEQDQDQAPPERDGQPRSPTHHFAALCALAFNRSPPASSSLLSQHIGALAAEQFKPKKKLLEFRFWAPSKEGQHPSEVSKGWTSSWGARLDVKNEAATFDPVQREIESSNV